MSDQTIRKIMPAARGRRAGGQTVQVEVDVILTGEIPTPHAYIYRQPGKGVARRVVSVLQRQGGLITTPMLAYVVRHPRAGTFLIDTGLHPDALGSPRRDYGVFLGAMFRQMRGAAAFDDQLRERGVDPATIELVVMTHLHVDHTGAMRLLPNAEFVCSTAEWRAARGRRAAANGYVARHLPAADRMRLLDFDANSTPHDSFSRTVDFFGDGSMRILFTPGHTLGHCSVLLDVAGRGPVLLVGDAAYTGRNISEQHLPAFTANDSLASRSLGELKAYSDAHPETPMIPSHDPTAWPSLVP